MANPAATLGSTGKFGDLKRRLLFLLGALIVYRIGAHIPVPGIDPQGLADLFQSQQGGILGGKRHGVRLLPFALATALAAPA